MTISKTKQENEKREDGNNENDNNEYLRKFLFQKWETFSFFYVLVHATLAWIFYALSIMNAVQTKIIPLGVL